MYIYSLSFDPLPFDPLIHPSIQSIQSMQFGTTQFNYISDYNSVHNESPTFLPFPFLLLFSSSSFVFACTIYFYFIACRFTGFFLSLFFASLPLFFTSTYPPLPLPLSLPFLSLFIRLRLFILFLSSFFLSFLSVYGYPLLLLSPYHLISYMSYFLIFLFTGANHIPLFPYSSILFYSVFFFFLSLVLYPSFSLYFLADYRIVFDF